MSSLESTVTRLATLWGLSEYAQSRQALAVIEVCYPYNAYVDESIQERHGTKVISVAAYVAAFDRWLEFESEWKGILRKYEVPLDGNPEHTEAFFHTTDFIARQKQFKNDWPDRKRDEFIERLAVTASEYPILGVATCINEEQYARALPEDIRGRWREPYFFCVWGVLGMLSLIEKKFAVALPKPVWVLFDRRQKAVQFAAQIFHAVKDLSEQKNVFGEMGFGEMWRTPQLQAADLLVYAAARNRAERDHDAEAATYKPLQTLSRNKKLLIIHVEEDPLREYVKFVRRAEQAETPD